jgi:putative exporter of polyketide antibiotics
MAQTFKQLIDILCFFFVVVVVVVVVSESNKLTPAELRAKHVSRVRESVKAYR